MKTYVIGMAIAMGYIAFKDSPILAAALHGGLLLLLVMWDMSIAYEKRDEE